MTLPPMARHPVIGAGSPCDLETECVHPTHGKKGAAAVGRRVISDCHPSEKASKHRN
jgi:hypothetical protein